MAFNFDNYEPVEARITRFWEKYPNGRIITSIVELSQTGGIFKAEIYTDREDALPVTVDFAEEIKGSSPVNKTSWLENGCTSAIGRALADLGFSPKGHRASSEEMAKVQRMTNFDWLAEARSKTTADDVRAVYAQAKAAGARAEILEAISAFGKSIVH